MQKYQNNTCRISLFVLLSLFAHVTAVYFLVQSGPFIFSAPIHPPQALFVNLQQVKAGPPQHPITPGDNILTSHHQRVSGQSAREERTAEKVESTVLPTKQNPVKSPAAGTTLSKDAKIAPEDSVNEKDIAVPENEIKKNPTDGHVPVATVYEQYKCPVRRTNEFLTTKKEKLTYRISLLKVPVGNAVVEATTIGEELRITVKISSNAIFSAIYPVDDLIETRMVEGNYLLTRVRQKEGSFQGDFGFTLLLREHKAFWVDRIANRYNYQQLPVDDAMDALSGFYFLRNQDLEIGKSVLLHLFDSNEYSPTMVEVLRRERMSLPGVGDVNTLVLHPLFKTAGFFRRTGDIMIWLTDDKFRVPVRLETYITLGKVTAELISAESEQEENVKEKEGPGTSFASPGN
ncbi:MAG: DUF3108 domain-containing protein [Geobacteraceae bacterium]|nr:DUF3108 domain-containing protein [Geobacteraceae bacterium]